MPKSTEEQIDMERAFAGAFALFLERANASAAASLTSSAPTWVGEMLDALAPLKALSPGHGELPDQEARKLADLQDALSRADLSKALDSEPRRSLSKSEQRRTGR